MIITRTSARFPDARILRASFGEIDAELLGEDRKHLRLLIDLRPAKGRNDPEFEEAMAKERQDLMRSFGEVALLVNSEIGRMQVLRHLAQDGLEFPVYGDEAAAHRWLRG